MGPVDTPAQSSTAAGQVWMIAEMRSMILNQCSRGTLQRCLVLSRSTFLETVQVLYKKLFQKDFFKLESSGRWPKRMPIYLDAVRHFVQPHPTSSFSIRHSFGPLFATFPNLVQYEFSGGHVIFKSPGNAEVVKWVMEGEVLSFAEFNENLPLDEGRLIPAEAAGHANYKGLERATTRPMCIKPGWREDDEEEEEDGSDDGSVVEDNSSLRYPWDEQEDKLGVPNSLQMCISELEILGRLEIKDFTSMLDRRQKFGFQPISKFVLQEIDDPDLLPSFLTRFRSTITDLEIRSPLCPLVSATKSPLWNAFRGLQHLKISLSIGEFGWRNPKVSKSRDPTNPPSDLPHIHPFPISFIPLHLSSFTLDLRHQDLRPSSFVSQAVKKRMARRLPRVREIARFMLDVGGPLCKYSLSISGEDDVEDLELLLATQVLREINDLLDTPSAERGWTRRAKSLFLGDVSH